MKVYDVASAAQRPPPSPSSVADEVEGVVAAVADARGEVEDAGAVAVVGERDEAGQREAGAAVLGRAG